MKKRIFPPERIGLGFLLLFGLIFFSIYLYPSNKGDFIFFLCIFSPGFIYCLHLFSAHTSYDSENLILWTFYKRKKIRFEDIIQICRKWEGSGKSTSLKWHIYYRNNNDKESKARLFLPENPDNKKINELFASIKKINHEAVIEINFK